MTMALSMPLLVLILFIYLPHGYLFQQNAQGTDVDDKFGSLAEKFESLHQHVLNLEDRVKEQERKIQDHEQKIAELENELNDYKKYFDQASQEEKQDKPKISGSKRTFLSKMFGQKRVFSKTLKTKPELMTLNGHVSNPNINSRIRRNVEGEFAFSAYLTHIIDHMAPGHVIKCDKTLLNDGNAYNPITGVFTVPVDGVYLLTFHIDSYTETHVTLVVDGGNTADSVSEPHVYRNGFEIMSGNTALIRLRERQSVWLEEYSNADGTVTSGEAYRFTTFSGVFMYA
ncbi:uncharacterized protein LOC128226466 [Mya arenaria]|uniref:uncharacterized protein LOC128226466 n=1 Tax=Mya arenaria TaxID=6604 RepID=UPI0022E93F75|nr:uncharacterized protein LOC128226466 [Mya arenaria]